MSNLFTTNWDKLLIDCGISWKNLGSHHHNILAIKLDLCILNCFDEIGKCQGKRRSIGKWRTEFSEGLNSIFPCMEGHFFYRSISCSSNRFYIGRNIPGWFPYIPPGSACSDQHDHENLIESSDRSVWFWRLFLLQFGSSCFASDSFFPSSQALRFGVGRDQVQIFYRSFLPLQLLQQHVAKSPDPPSQDKSKVRNSLSRSKSNWKKAKREIKIQLSIRL